MSASKNALSKNPSSRRWCITDNTIGDKDPENWSDTFNDNVKYAVWQLEISKTGHLHIQAYLKFHKPCRISAVHKILPGVHCEIPVKGDEENISYCTKVMCRKEPTFKTQVKGPFFHGECDSQGQRRDLDELSDLLHAGKSTDEIAYEQTAAFIRYNKGIQAAHQALTRKKAKTWRNVQVIVYWGPPGTGKTRRCWSEEPDLFAPGLSNTGLWWDGYMGESAILLDDFYGQYKMADMLRILDGHPLAIPIKGGQVNALWTKVFITSNVHPDNWYSKADIPDDVRLAFERRIRSIIRVSAASPMNTDPLDLSQNLVFDFLNK